MTTAHQLALEPLPGVNHVQLTKIITSPQGKQFRAVTTGNITVLADVKHPKGDTIIIEGGTAALSFGDIVDGVGGALSGVLGGLLKLISCKPKTVTTGKCNDKGVVQSIETVTTCDPA